MVSERNIDYGTPDWLFKLLNEEFHFTIDACGTDEQADMMPGVVEPGSPMDDLRRERSETLIELFKNTTSIVTQFINQLISEDWQQAPPETHIFLCNELDRLIAVASQAKEFLHINN